MTPLLCADRSCFCGNRAAFGTRRHPRQEHLHCCQCWREMAENPAGAQELLQATDLVDMQETGALLHQGRHGQEGLQAQTLHQGPET